MSRPRQLTPGQARRTVAARATRIVDRARQLEVDAGVRPYNVFLVWSVWSGGARGKGVERIAARVPIVPNPTLDLTGLSRELTAAGYSESGTVRLDEISAAYSSDELSGYLSPRLCQLHDLEEVPQPYDFYYEVAEDGRNDDLAARRKFQVAGPPSRNAFDWTIRIERMSVDNQRGGEPTKEPPRRRKPNEKFDGEEDA